MDNKDTAYFKQLAKNILFELNEEEAQDIQKEFETLIKQLSLLEVIDTTKVEPMVYPFEEETSFLREDEANHTVSQSEAIGNALKTKQGHFSVPRVVK